MEAPRHKDKEDFTENTQYSLVKSMGHLGFLAFPIFFQEVFRFAQVFINYYFVGVIDNPYMLGGMGLAMFFYVIMAMAMLVGFNAVITTFISQLRGMGRTPDCVYYLNGGRIVNFILCIPLMVVLGFSNPILLAMN